MDINKKKASYLYERNYENHKDDNIKEHHYYWEEINGTSNIEYLYKKYRNSIYPFLDGNNNYAVTNEICNKKLFSLYQRGLYEEEKFDLSIIADKIFFPFYVPFIKLALYWTKIEYPDSIKWKETLKNSYILCLQERLESRCIRTLVSEISLYKEELEGENEKEEYLYYIHVILNDESYIEEIFQAYPLLLRCIMETIYQFSEFIVDVVKKIYQDKQEIMNEFNFKKMFCGIDKIESTSGDLHKKGKTVLKIFLDNKEIIFYKPHSIKAKSIYYDIIQHLYNMCNLDSYSYGFLDKGDYSWEALVLQCSCTTVNELRRYYKRIGIQLCFNYILGTQDLHYENLIAYGEYPLFIDLETLFRRMENRSSDDSASQKVQKMLDTSVLQIGILPYNLFFEGRKGVDLSAVNGQANQKTPFLVPTVKNAKTSEIEIGYSCSITKPNKNLALLNDKYIEAGYFLEEISSGFTITYEYIMNNKMQFKKMCERFENLEIRYLRSNTQEYAMLLITSYHPDFMKDGGDRQLFLSNRYKTLDSHEKNSDEIIEVEVKELLNGDIPYFHFNSSQKDLYVDESKMITDFFSLGAIEQLSVKIDFMDKGDLEFQKRLIYLTVCSKFSNIFKSDKGQCLEEIIKKNHTETKPATEIIIEAAEKIGDFILSTAIFNDNETEVSWVGSTFNEECHRLWRVQAIDQHLYNGIAGISIFMHALDTISSRESYKAICNVLDLIMFKYTDGLLDGSIQLRNKYSGALGGEGSIVYTYQVLYRITKKIQYLNYAEKHSGILKDIIVKDSSYDLTYGNAGVILIFINMFRLTGKKKYLDISSNAAKLLEKHKIIMQEGIGWKNKFNDIPLTGLAHGNSGIIMALGKLSKLADNSSYIEVIRDALKYENSLFDKMQGNWKDIRYSEKKVSDKEPVYWCHGAAGIMLSRIAILGINDMDIHVEALKDIECSLNTIYKTPFNKHQCLCHGNCGIIEVLHEYAYHDNDRVAKNICITYINNFAKKIIDNTIEISTLEAGNPGFMIGLSGIGYAFLHIIRDDMPNILSFDI